MKTRIKSAAGLGAGKRAYLFAMMAVVLILLSICGMAASSGHGIKFALVKLWGPSISATIHEQIAAHQKELYYPASVERFYKRTGDKLVWVAPDTVKTNASTAMMLLDCVLQYGLNHSEYHPSEITYDKLNGLIKQFSSAGNDDKARFDMMLTDAMLNFMNNLHFGKLNPDYPETKIDAGEIHGFAADSILAAAIKAGDFTQTILNVQPHSMEYTALQNHLHLLAGQYVGDCYDVPEGDMRKIGINMERLRWVNTEDNTYVHINIPSFTLKFHQPDSIYEFKVIVGKPIAPTPTLQSAISYFTTAPERNVMQKIFINELLPKARKHENYFENNHFVIYDDKGRYIEANNANLARVRQNPAKYHARQTSGCESSLGSIVFRFTNIYDIYLHDTPEQQLFSKPERAFSHGCVRLEHAENFAELLLANDGSADLIPDLHKAWTRYQNKNFLLKKAVPIKISYLTCEVKNGEMIFYNDLYNLDESLAMALYNIYQPLAVK